MMKHVSTSVVTLLVGFGLVGAPLMPLVERGVPVARAQAPIQTVEVGPVLGAALTSAGADTATAGATTVQTTIMQILNGLAWTVAKTAIQSMTRSIVTWINSGFNGSPAFVTDLNRNLRNLSDGVAAQFFNDLTASGAVDSPYLERIALGVGTAYYLHSSEDRIARRLRYTLNEYSRNDRAFLDGDFREGGFNAWFALWTEQANNPIGAQYIAGQELAAQLEAASFERLQELMYGRGFLSWKGECLVRDDTVSLSEEEGCLQHDTLTPGVVIERQLGITLESPLRQLELADSINEIVGALAVQMVTQVVGATGLLGASRPSSGGGGSSLSRATDPNVYQPSTVNLSQGLSTRVERDRTDVIAYRTAWQRIQSAAQNADQALQGVGTCTDREEKRALVTQTLNSASLALTKATNSIGALDAILARIASATADTLNIASNEYLALMSGGTLPGAAELANAQSNSQDTGSVEPGSLYSQMTRIARECGS